MTTFSRGTARVVICLSPARQTLAPRRSGASHGGADVRSNRPLDPSPGAGERSFGNRAGVARHRRPAGDQPCRRPPAHHPRGSIGRRVDRFRHGVGARGSAVAHAGRDRHDRQFQGYPAGRVRRRPAGERPDRQGADRAAAGRAGRVLSHPVSGPVVADRRRRAGRGPLPHGAWRPPLDLVPVVGRHRWPGLGHRRSARRHAHLRHHAAQPAGFLHSQRRQYLRRRTDRRRAEDAQRRSVAQRRDRGQGQGGGDARRVSRKLQIQPPRPERPRLQRRSADLHPMGRSRGHQQLVAGRAAYPGGAPAQEICGKERVAARGARRPRVPRIHAAAPGRVYRKISYGPLLDIFMLDMRSYRGPNGEGLEEKYGPDAYFLGPQQVAWLKRELVNSQATWKVIAADMPIGLIVVYDGDRKWGVEAVAQGDGPARGRELEIADLLSFIKRAGVRNTVWLTADVHYTAAHYYDPGKAVFQDFEPFWEFVSGPLHAGTFGPNQLDNTFGPQLMYLKAPTKEQGQNLPPSEGLQFFGQVAIDGATEVMTVTLKDADDRALSSTKLEPRLG